MVSAACAAFGTHTICNIKRRLNAMRSVLFPTRFIQLNLADSITFLRMFRYIFLTIQFSIH